MLYGDYGPSYLGMPGTAAIDTQIVMGSIASGNNAGLGIIFVFSGVDQISPMDTSATTATGTGTRKPNPPAITPVTSGAVIVSAGGSSAGVSALSSSDMTGMLSVVFTGNSWSGQGGMARKMDWSSGAFDPAQWTGPSGGGVDSWCAGTLALRPATAGVTPVYVGGVMASYAGSASLTIPLNSGLSGGTRDHILAGDCVVVAQLCASGTTNINMNVITTGYTELMDLYSNASRDFNLGMFHKIIT